MGPGQAAILMPQACQPRAKSNRVRNLVERLGAPVSKQPPFKRINTSLFTICHSHPECVAGFGLYFRILGIPFMIATVPILRRPLFSALAVPTVSKQSPVRHGSRSCSLRRGADRTFGGRTKGCSERPRLLSTNSARNPSYNKPWWAR